MYDGMLLIMVLMTGLQAGRLLERWSRWRLDQGPVRLSGDGILIPVAAMQFRGSALLARHVFGNELIADSLQDDALVLESLNSPR
jgi:hypothetical protein